MDICAETYVVALGEMGDVRQVVKVQPIQQATHKPVHPIVVDLVFNHIVHW